MFRGRRAWIVIGLLTLPLVLIVIVTTERRGQATREDGAELLPIDLDGSIQNAAWSPTAEQIVFTRFRNGYNKPPADLFVFDLKTESARALSANGASNVSQPGSTWNAKTGQILFSSDQDNHDQIFMIGSTGASPRKLTSDEKYMGYEPSWSPDGRSFVYEMHRVGEEGGGIVVRATVDTGQIEELTQRGDDCRQPNWSPRGDIIIYQKKEKSKSWDLWIYDLASKTHRQLVRDFPGEKTDATFSPDGRWVVYSADSPDLRLAALFVTQVGGGRPIRITNSDFYDGAPSWSPDGNYIVFESSTRVPPRSGLRSWFKQLWAPVHWRVGKEPDTTLWKIKVPSDLRNQLCSGERAPCG